MTRITRNHLCNQGCVVGIFTYENMNLLRDYEFILQFALI